MYYGTLFQVSLPSPGWGAGGAGGAGGFSAAHSDLRLMTHKTQHKGLAINKVFVVGILRHLSEVSVDAECKRVTRKYLDLSRVLIE